MFIMLSLAWRNLWTHKLRTVLAIISIMLAVAVIMAVRTANGSTYNSIQALFNEAAGRTNLTVESPASSRQSQIGFSQSLAQQVQSIPGVVQVAPRLISQTVYDGKHGLVNLAVEGVDPAIDEQVRTYYPVEGTFLSNTSRGYTVVLVDEFAQREGIHAGKDVDLLTPNGTETFRVVGIVARKAAGVTNGGQLVFMPLKVAQEVFNRGRNIDAVDIVAQPGIAQSVASLQQLKADMQTALGDGYSVGYPAAKGLTVTEALSGVQYALGLFGLFALFASTLLIYTTFTMEITERIREVGTLRTLGSSRSQIMMHLVSSALFLSLIGSLLGLGLGFVLAVPLLQLFASLTGYQLTSLSPAIQDIAFSFLLGVIVTTTSALVPAIQACRLSPMEAVRVRGSELGSRIAARSWIIGLILLAFWGASFFIPWLSNLPMFLVFFMGATFLLPGAVQLIGQGVRVPMAALYGYEGSLGATNMERSRWRTSTTVAVLMVGIAMSISIGAVSDSLMGAIRSWLDGAMSADLFVSSYTSMSATWGKRLAAINDIEVISPERRLDVQVQDPQQANRHVTLRLEAIEPTTQALIGKMIYASGQGDPNNLWATFAQGGSVLISTQVADAYNIHQGDLLRVQTPRGEQQLPVAGVIVYYNSMRGTILMTWNDLDRFFGVNNVDTYLIKVKPDANVGAVRQQIESQYGRSGGLVVQSNAEFRQAVLQSTGMTMLAFNAIVLIAFIIAAFSIANTLMMNVLERTREIGLLRAVGMNQFQTSKMILAEALVMGSIAVVFGIAFGGVFSKVVIWWMGTGMGFRVDYVLPVMAVLTSCILALAISQIAALLPARRVSRFDIMDALRYE